MPGGKRALSSGSIRGILASSRLRDQAPGDSPAEQRRALEPVHFEPYFMMWSEVMNANAMMVWVGL